MQLFFKTYLIRLYLYLLYLETQNYVRFVEERGFSASCFAFFHRKLLYFDVYTNSLRRLSNKNIDDAFIKDTHREEAP